MAGLEPVFAILFGTVFAAFGVALAVEPRSFANRRGLGLIERVAGERVVEGLKRFGGAVMALLAAGLVVGSIVELLP